MSVDEQMAINRRVFVGAAVASAGAGLLPADEVAELTDAYLTIRRHINHLALQEEPALAGVDELVESRQAVARIWDRLLGKVTSKK